MSNLFTLKISRMRKVTEKKDKIVIVQIVMSVLGMIGFIIAGILDLWLAIATLKSGRLEDWI